MSPLAGYTYTMCTCGKGGMWLRLKRYKIAFSVRYATYKIIATCNERITADKYYACDAQAYKAGEGVPCYSRLIKLLP